MLMYNIGMKSPLVTVIIPVYNRKALLQEAAASVLAQTLTDFELIIADDGSTDGSLKTALRLADSDKRIRVLNLEHSGFPGAVRNRAAEKAESEYLAFLDSDDLWMPEKLEKQLAVLVAHPDVPLVHTREVWQRGAKIISQKSQKHQREGDLFSDALGKCIIGPSTTVMSRKVFDDLGGFREDMEIAEDYEFWIRYCSRYKTGYIDEPLITKRAAHGKPQLSEKYGQIEVFRIDGLKKLVEQKYFKKHSQEKQSLAEKELKKKCEIYAQGCEKRGRNQEAAQYRSLYKNLPL